jgi:hypothetical protein
MIGSVKKKRRWESESRHATRPGIIRTGVGYLPSATVRNTGRRETPGTVPEHIVRGTNDRKMLATAMLGNSKFFSARTPIF